MPGSLNLHTNAYSADDQHVSAKYVLVLFIIPYFLRLPVLYCRYGLYVVFDNRLKNPCTIVHYIPLFKKNTICSLSIVREGEEEKEENSYTRKTKKDM